MLPNIGFIDTYALMIVIGVIMSFVFLHLYYGKKRKSTLTTIELNALFAIIIGIVFANIFQNIYDYIDHPNSFSWSWGLTFYGGLIGGAGSFLLLYFFVFKKKYGSYLEELLIVAPSSIAIAHGIGRIGCFLAGCCYGKETNSWLGVYFPHVYEKVLPTNLFEAIFLILLASVLLFLAIKYRFKYNFAIYMISYGIWRFIIEYFRGDYRGSFIGNISPSQFWSIILVIGGIIYGLFTYFRNHRKNDALVDDNISK